MIDLACLPPLSDLGRPEKPSLDKARQAIYGNGQVFHTLGPGGRLRRRAGGNQRNLKYLYPHALSVRFCGDQFLEGLHFGLGKRNARQIPAPMTAAGLIVLLEPRLEDRELPRLHRQALYRRLRQAFAHPFGKRSLVARLTDRLERTFHRSFW